jgi:hypothetical protein
MNDIFNWIENILAIYAAAIVLATLIVRLTPTLKDDNWLLAVIKFMAKYIAIYRGFRPVDDNAIRNKPNV